MLIVIGDINVDVMMAIAHWPHEGGDALAHTATWSNGGTGLNAATAVGRMGGAVRLWGRTGTDAAANQVIQHATSARIDISDIQQDHAIPTGLCVIPVTPHGERTFLSYRGANQHWQVPLYWPAPAGWVMVCGHALLSDPQRQNAILALRYAQQHGWQTVVDVCEPLAPQFDTVMAQVSQPLTLLCGNEAEMHAMHGLPLSSYATTRITKLGAGGAHATHGTHQLHGAGFAVDAVDTTGCGDTFVAVCSWALSHGAPIHEALQVANAAGAIMASRRGAADVVPGYADVRAFLHDRAVPLPAWFVAAQPV